MIFTLSLVAIPCPVKNASISRADGGPEWTSEGGFSPPARLLAALTAS